MAGCGIRILDTGGHWIDADRRDDPVYLGWHRAPVLAHPGRHSTGRPLAYRSDGLALQAGLASLGAKVDARHPGVRSERDKLRRPLDIIGLGRQAVLVRAQLDDAAAFRGAVGQAGKPRRSGQLGAVTSPTGISSVACRLPSVIVPVLSSKSVLTSPAASTARPEVASTLRWINRSIPAIPMAKSRAPDGAGDQAD